MSDIQRQLNILWVAVVCMALIGAYWFELASHMLPCHLCYFQRLAMVGMGASALLNLRYGIRIGHYILGILFGAVGSLIAFRLPAFGGEIFGLGLSVWSGVVYLGCILGAICLLLLFKLNDEQSSSPSVRWGFAEKAAFGLLSFLVIANIISVTAPLLGFNLP